MNLFHAVDWLIIAFYILCICGLGIWLGRDQQNTRDYFLGSRSVPWWAIGLSIVAAETSALTIIGVPALAYGSNLTFIQMMLGYVLARFILAIVLVPYYFKGEIYSPYQLLANTFGPGARQASGAIFLVSETLAAGVRVYVACIPIQLLLGVHVLTAILLFIVFSLAYTYVGGVKAVIWTDAVQFGLFLAGGLFALKHVPSLLPGGWEQVVREAGQAGKLVWLDTRFSWSIPFNLWMGLIGGTFVTLSSHGAEQLIVQRVLACRSVRDGRRALMLSAVLIVPLFLVFLFAGVLLWVYYQHFPLGLPLPEARPGIKANDFIFPIFMLTAVPHGLKGFLIVAILSAAMSSVSSALTSLASVSTMDFAKPWLQQDRAESFYLRLSKASTVFWAATLVGVAYLSREVVFVLNAAFSLRGLTSGALLGGLGLALFWRRGSSRPVVAGMAASLFAMIWISWRGIGGTKIDWPWFTFIGTFVTVSVAWLTRAALEAGRPTLPLRLEPP